MSASSEHNNYALQAKILLSPFDWLPWLPGVIAPHVAMARYNPFTKH